MLLNLLRKPLLFAAVVEPGLPGVVLGAWVGLPGVVLGAWVGLPGVVLGAWIAAAASACFSC
jgi:hypothetical protein